jgi:N-acetyl-anhydromuramyl-L-alanine amidase AmpD
VAYVNARDKVIGATLSTDANLNGIHIEIVGDFNKGKPYEIQYDTVRKLIADIQSQHPDAVVKKH